MTNALLLIATLIGLYAGVLAFYRLFGRTGLYCWVAIAAIVAIVAIVAIAAMAGAGLWTMNRDSNDFFHDPFAVVHRSPIDMADKPAVFDGKCCGFLGRFPIQPTDETLFQSRIARPEIVGNDLSVRFVNRHVRPRPENAVMVVMILGSVVRQDFATQAIERMNITSGDSARIAFRNVFVNDGIVNVGKYWFPVFGEIQRLVVLLFVEME